MPIILNDDNSIQRVDATGKTTAAVSNSSQFSPKFFHKSVLTGHGGTSKGLLCEARDPKFYKDGYRIKIDENLGFGTNYNGNVKIYTIPFSILASAWGSIETMPAPNMAEFTKIAEKNGHSVYLWVPIHGIVIEEIQTASSQGSATIHRELSAAMRCFLFFENGTPGGDYAQVSTFDTVFHHMNSNRNVFYQDMMYTIFNLRNYADKLMSNGYNVDKDAMNQFVQDYSLYREICLAAERWITKTDEYIALLASNYNAKHGTNPNAPEWRPSYWGKGDTLPDILSRLEFLSVPLDIYDSMYKKLKSILSQDILNAVCKANLNLRLSNTLNNMNNKRASLNYCTCTNHIQGAIPYSNEQIAAIESDSPLTLVQSGAGTGKSTVILGRIDHMMANGISADDITVLSFTNAAANHINDLKPDVHSMTIASMLHTIYSANFPTHQLSSISTIINSLDIYFNPSLMPMTSQKSTFISDFRYILERLRDNNEYTRANNFVEDNVNDVIDALNVIEQTCLELESIICYLKMDTLVEPPETKTAHLIVDEVQDNSIAEFIYCIQYTEKHNNSLYIVGDCSQTLYEFRSSNPKALNVLEGSGVFKTFKLQTNYRSNQEILDFANVGLSDIEANRYANIQLYANSLNPVTLQSFQNAVQIYSRRMTNRAPKTVDDSIVYGITSVFHNFIKDKLDKGKQVTFLAPRRQTLKKIEETLRVLYHDRKLVSLVPIRQYDSAIFSKFISRFWNKISYVPPKSIMNTIRDTLMSNLHMMSYGSQANHQKTQQIAVHMLDDFEKQCGGAILNFQRQVSLSIMTQRQMLDQIKKMMIAFEIKRNAVAQALISNKNNEAKLAADVANADFILSTIHSAKGLEFDNVIIYHDAESTNNIGEDTKRMYYVAFTRAKEAEFIYSMGTLARPKIMSDYDYIIKKLTKKAKNSANGSMVASNINITDDDDDVSYGDDDQTNVIMAQSNTPYLPESLMSSNTSDEDDDDDEDVNEAPFSISLDDLDDTDE